MEVGRPTKYKPEYPQVALEYIGTQGKSIVQLARHLEVSRDTIYQWAKDHQDFSDALSQARDWSEAYWEEKFVGFMTDRNTNAPLVKLYFANRFKWSDSSKADDDDAAPPPSSVTVERRNACKPEQPAG